MKLKARDATDWLCYYWKPLLLLFIPAYILLASWYILPSTRNACAVGLSAIGGMVAGIHRSKFRLPLKWIFRTLSRIFTLPVKTASFIAKKVTSVYRSYTEKSLHRCINACNGGLVEDPLDGEARVPCNDPDCDMARFQLILGERQMWVLNVGLLLNYR